MWTLTLLAALLWSPGIICAEEARRTVSTSYATYSGNFTAPSSLAFLGIPYAEPPVGNLRFRKPVPLNTQRFNKSSVIDAGKYPKSCIQGAIGIGDSGGAGSEDCLKVNIYTPVSATPASKLPVLFYIHGGGYLLGNPKSWTFDHWINQSPNIVVVSVYYRLSSFGFLSHPALSQSSLGDNNAGFLDQIQALKWVKENIAAFGGDPEHITINGESAGGGSVQLHLVSPESRGLFHGAIAQSVYRPSMPTPEQQADLFNFYANQAGCGSNVISDVMECLRAAPVYKIAKAQDARLSLSNSLYKNWVPVLDGKTFVDYPTNSLKQGNFAKVPIIAGSTTDEVIGATPGNPLLTSLSRLYPQVTAQDVNEYIGLYSQSQFSSQNALFEAAVGETLLRCAREIIGNAAVQNREPVWTYRYNQPNPVWDPPGVTGHAAENWMMFEGVFTGLNGTAIHKPLDPVQTAFSQELIAYWISFVRSFDPNVHKLPRSPGWTGFDKGVRNVLQQDPSGTTTMSGIALEWEPEAEARRCQFIASKSNVLQA